MFRLVPVLIFCYLSIRLVYPLPLKWGPKIALTAMVLLLSQQQLIVREFFGGWAAPDISQTVMLLQGWLLGALLFLALLVLLVDIVGVLFVLGRFVGLPLSLPCSFATRAAAMTLVALALSGYALWQGVRVPDPRVEEVTLERLPPALDGLVLVQISDLHASTLLRGPRVRAIVDLALAQKPDLILLTGDIVDGSPEARAEDVAAFKDLRATYGVFACLGNHEYYSGYAAWKKTFKDLGVRVLENEHAVFSRNGRSFVVAGVADPVASRFSLPGPDTKAAFSGAPAKAFRVLLAHQPRLAEANLPAGADLQLSGHTHGGQILGSAPLAAKLNNGFLSGWYTIDEGPNAPGSMRLYVNRGAGLWSGFPLRLGVPAEVTRIVLRSPK